MSVAGKIKVDKMQKIKLLIFLLFAFSFAHAQSPIGLPNIVNYERSDYQAGLQNRKIDQDKNGILYFANSEGLLSFDGAYWKLYPLPNQTIVRSVAVGKDNRIYVGGQNELGYFSPDKNGHLVFTSLKPLLPKNALSFKDVWDIVAFNNQLFFRSLNHIFLFDGNTIKDSRPFLQWQFLGLCGRQLFAADAGRGLFRYSNGDWQPVSVENKNIKVRDLGITAVLPLSKDSLLVATLKKGLFILNGNHLSVFKLAGDPFKNQLILCAMSTEDGRIAIGTQLAGMYIIGSNGQLIQNLSRKDGLQNNTILSIFSDRAHNLWIGLDDGIDFYAYNSAIKHIYPERLNEGTGYSAIVFDKKLYIGTSNALYELPVGDNADISAVNGEFKEVENTKGSVWGLAGADHQLLMAHHEGAFRINGDRAFPVSTRSGYWNFIPLANKQHSLLLAGNYNGLDLFVYDGHNFQSTGNTQFSESSRFVVVDGGDAWISHNYKGIYRIDLGNTAKPPHLYTDKDGLPSLLKNRVFRIKNQMVASTLKGIYTYNPQKDKFQPSSYYQHLLGQAPLSYLKEDGLGNIWFIENKKLGVVDFSGMQPRLIYFPELDGKLVSDFENIYPFNEENIFVGAEKGFFHVNYSQYKKDANPIHVLISQVKASGDTDVTLNDGYSTTGLKSRQPRLSNKQNSFHFEYAAQSFQKSPSVEYSCFLQSFDQQWSSWAKRTEKDYTNLPPGHYAFMVKARSNLGDESAVTTYAFIILPPWYKTWWAYAVYGILFAVFNYLFYRWLKRKFSRQRQKYEQEQARLTYVHQLEKDQKEKEIIALKNEKLENEIIGKNSELAAVAMHLLQKSELMTRIREELEQLRKSGTDMPSEELKKLIRLLNQESRTDKEWDQFAVYFDATHSDFLKAVKQNHPLLSPHELKLCAYLRMNLSSKEIAQLLNISVRGVEISRYRLRKKISVAKETNLHQYFNEFSRERKES
jgi:ligand-binding sensor domain-containing protein/DNA-binding CsgD family transcriptional regulator